MRRICTTAAAIGLIALAAATSPAFASGFTLRLSAPSTPVVGKPLILEATGTIDLDELAFPYWFSLDAIPTSVTSTCPADFQWAQPRTSTRPRRKFKAAGDAPKTTPEQLAAAYKAMNNRDEG